MDGYEYWQEQCLLLGATFYTTLQATPARLVFGRDAIIKSKFEAYWHLIKNNKQKTNPTI
jgi:hypothetical protein